MKTTTNYIAGNRIIRSLNNIVMLQLATNRYNIVEYDEKNGTVMSVLPVDSPRHDTGRWSACATDAGIEYVSSSRSKNAAFKQWRTYIANCPQYVIN